MDVTLGKGLGHFRLPSPYRALAEPQTLTQGGTQVSSTIDAESASIVATQAKSVVLVDGMRRPISRSTDKVSKQLNHGLEGPMKKEIGHAEQ